MINKFMSIGPFPNLIRQKKMMSRCLATTASDPVNYINKYFFSAPNETIDKNKNSAYIISTQGFWTRLFGRDFSKNIFLRIFFGLEFFGRALLNKIIWECFLSHFDEVFLTGFIPQYFFDKIFPT